ncbi:MAG: PDC sensor domain-containing protein [Tabrizicola sp.]
MTSPSFVVPLVPADPRDRLGATLMLALLPLGLLSIVQTRDALAQLDATTLEGVGGAAVQSVRPQIELINQARISARAPVSILSRQGPDGPACRDWVRSLARDIPQAILVAHIPLTGLMTCSSTGAVFDFTDNPRLRVMVETPVPRLIYSPQGPVSGMAIVGVAHPVFDASGAAKGFVTI